jgi:hypothetical protein
MDKYKQSSCPNLIPLTASNWGQSGPGLVVCLGVVQGFGLAGDFHRRSFTGGAAKGTP